MRNIRFFAGIGFVLLMIFSLNFAAGPVITSA